MLSWWMSAPEDVNVELKIPDEFRLWRWCRHPAVASQCRSCQTRSTLFGNPCVIGNWKHAPILNISFDLSNVTKCIDDSWHWPLEQIYISTPLILLTQLIFMFYKMFLPYVAKFRILLLICPATFRSQQLLICIEQNFSNAFKQWHRGTIGSRASLSQCPLQSRRRQVLSDFCRGVTHQLFTNGTRYAP